MKSLLNMRRLSVIGLVIMSIAGDLFAQEMVPWKEIPANNDCGVNCLVVACKLLGKTTDKHEMSALAKLDVQGTNFQNLAFAAKQKGLVCKGVKWSLRQLRKWNKLAIAHWDNHFVLVQRFENPTTIRVIDPPRMPFSMGIDEFNKKWDGKLLLLSNEPISIFVGLGWIYVCIAAIILCVAALTALLWTRFPAARRSNKVEDGNLVSQSKRLASMLLLAYWMVLFTPNCLAEDQKETAEKVHPAKSYIDVGNNKVLNHEVDFGRVIQGSKLKYVVVLVNKSRKSIKIKGVTTSCACAAAILSEKNIPQKGSAQVEIDFDAEGLFGKVSKPSLIRFENSDLKPIRLELKAYVYVPGARFTKSGIYFDKVAAGTEVIRTIDIANKGDKESKWKIAEVHTSSPIIEAEYLPNRSEILCKLIKDAPIGPINEKVTVMIKDPNGISPTEIPVSGEVVGSLKVIPERLYLGTVKKNSPIEHSFSIINLRKDEPVTVSPTAANKMKLSLEQKESGWIVYSVKLHAPDNTGFFKGEIRFETNLKEQTFLSLPYAGFVQD